MKKIIPLVTFFILISLSFNVVAHVPYFEHKDFTEENPFNVRKMVTQSKAIYSWLENDGVNPCEDIDVYELKVIRKITLYLELIVPVVDDLYEDFAPWFALVGPDLPVPSQYLPFDVPEGYGAIIMSNVNPGEPRLTFYEPFGGKKYYHGPIFTGKISKRGTYYVYCWDPHQQGGDYTIVIGDLEIWGPLDIARAIIYIPLIRLGFELHSS